MKIFVTGHGGHGKGTACEIISDLTGLRSVSSSMVLCNEPEVIDYMRKQGVSDGDLNNLYDARRRHRLKLFNAARDYNRLDPTRLSRHIFCDWDIYDGIRSRVEFMASRHLADLSIWVSAAPRMKCNDPTMVVQESDCDVTIKNCGDKDDLCDRLTRLFSVVTSNVREEMFLNG